MKAFLGVTYLTATVETCWYYKAAALGEIKMIAVRQRGALRGVRLVVYDSVCDYIRRAAQIAPAARKGTALGLDE